MTLLWLLAVVLVIWGIVKIVQGDVFLGIVLVIIGFLIGPGGVSIFSTVSTAVVWPSLNKAGQTWKCSLSRRSRRSSGSSYRSSSN